MKKVIIFIFSLTFLLACNSDSEDKNELSKLYVYPVVEEGEVAEPYKFPDFLFADQDSQAVRLSDLKGKIYVLDFFFSRCPSMCPVMSKQMARVYEVFKGNECVHFVSISIDPEYDQPPILKKYANKLEIEGADQWHFLTGSEKETYDLAEKLFEVRPTIDGQNPGNILHDGSFHLIDTKGQIRLRRREVKSRNKGMISEVGYKGIDPSSIDILIDDIKILLENCGR